MSTTLIVPLVIVSMAFGLFVGVTIGYLSRRRKM